MTCRKLAEYNGRAGRQRLVEQTPSGPVFAPFSTEDECNQACGDGACCEGATCSVKPKCQCHGAGKTFKGVGTTCGAGTCCCVSRSSFPFTLSAFTPLDATKFPQMASVLNSFSGTASAIGCEFGFIYRGSVFSHCSNIETSGLPAPYWTFTLSVQGLVFECWDCLGYARGAISDPQIYSDMCGGRAVSKTLSGEGLSSVLFSVSANPLP
jgi:hypothetical protein